MRDAFGGVFMIRLMLVFIFILVAFGAISLKYATAFRVKNHVISFIEENEININRYRSYFSLSDINSNIDELGAILDKANYTVSCPNGDGIANKEEVNEGLTPYYCYHGVMIYPHEDGNVMRYEVSTYVNWNLGFLNIFLKLGNGTGDHKQIIGGWEINGEARVVNRKAG